MSATSILGASFNHRRTESSLRNQAYLQIRKKIISGVMAPASLINEGELLKEMKIGRTPIRQALRQLAHESLVVILPRRGTMVADVNSSDLQKVFNVRIQIVPYAFRLAAKKASARQIEEMDTYLDEMRAMIEKGDAAELLDVDEGVHRKIVDACQNEFLIEVLDRLYNHSRRFWRVDHTSVEDLRKIVRQYRDIVAAIKLRNGARAAKLIRLLMLRFHDQQMATI